MKEGGATRVPATFSLTVMAFIRIVIMSSGACSLFILYSSHPAEQAYVLRLNKASRQQGGTDIFTAVGDFPTTF